MTVRLTLDSLEVFLAAMYAKGGWINMAVSRMYSGTVKT